MAGGGNGSSSSFYFATLSPPDLELAQELIRSRLTDLGYQQPKGKGAAKGKRNNHIVGGGGGLPKTPAAKTPGKGQQTSGGVRIFGRPIRDLSKVLVPLPEDPEEEMLVPKILVSLCDPLRPHLDTEGIFRKSGSAARQKSLRRSLEHSESWEELLSEASVLDVASVLKQWLRELPEPLLPTLVQQMLLDCWVSLAEKPVDRSEAVLLITGLLTPNHSATLLYFVRFLTEVSNHSAANKMDFGNLAIVLTPTLFPVDDAMKSASIPGSSKKGASSSAHIMQANDNLSVKTEIVQELFQQGKKVGSLSGQLEDAFTSALSIALPTASQSEDNLDYEDHASSTSSSNFAGPSARRRKKKKRRSGSLSRVLTATMKGLQKAISRSATPTPAFSGHAPEDWHSVHVTPLPSKSSKSSQFTSPRLPVKRKAGTEHEHSPNSKQQRKQQLTAPFPMLDSSFTPKVRSRSFSVKKKFKRKKSLKISSSSTDSTAPGGANNPTSSVELSNFSPLLPNKPKISLTLGTPGTPKCLDLPRQGCDIESPLPPSSSLGKPPSPKAGSLKSSKAANASSSVSVQRSDSSSRSSRSSKPSGSDRQSRRPRSPSERKIGQIRRRSQDAARKAAAVAAITSSSTSNLAKNLPSTLSQPAANKKFVSPKSQPTSSNSSRNNSDKKNGNKIKHNESLVNLRHDINSFIEKSFAAEGNSALVQNISGIGFLDDVPDSGLSRRCGSQNSSSESSAFNVAVQGITGRIEAVSMNDEVDFPPASNTRFRRQSSAFEFSRSLSLVCPNKQEFRRQSSAFEIAAHNSKFGGLNNPDEDGEPIYENFGNRGTATRASLRRRNSSVKDLIMKLESGRKKKPGTSSLPPVPPKKPAAVHPLNLPPSEPLTQSGSPDDEWMDASEFFKNPVLSSKHLKADENSVKLGAADGCKRSSIIKIRQENRGLVSKSVKTFTRPLPMAPPTAPPLVAPATPVVVAPATPTPAVNSRRLSARMGISSSSHRAGIGAPSPLNRTGIRTTTNYKMKATTPGTKISVVHTYENILTPKTIAQPNARHDSAAKRTPSSAKKTPRGDRKSKRLEGRRHLTIGYEGEQVRSPLREKQNIVVTVQRSKSAQTPLQNKPTKQKKETPPVNHDEYQHQMVRRSRSMKQENSDPNRMMTPKSDKKVRRHVSDRISDSPSRQRMAAPPMKGSVNTPRSQKMNLFVNRPVDSPYRPLRTTITIHNHSPSVQYKGRVSPRVNQLY